MTDRSASVSEDALHLARTRMGRAIRGWALGPGAVVEGSEGHWLVLSGAPSPDVNLALVHSADDDTLRHALDVVADVGAPTLLCLAGAASAETLPPEWQAVGEMPLMEADLESVPTMADERVRIAGADDLDATIALLSEAFAMDPEVARVAVEPVLTGLTSATSDMRFWLLVDGGVPVSGVLDARTDDVVTVWCMGTAPRHTRLGHGRALLAHVLDAARGDGMTTGLLGATPAGRPLYEATGWRTVDEWRLFVGTTSAQPT